MVRNWLCINITSVVLLDGVMLGQLTNAQMSRTRVNKSIESTFMLQIMASSYTHQTQAFVTLEHSEFNLNHKFYLSNNLLTLNHRNGNGSGLTSGSSRLLLLGVSFVVGFSNLGRIWVCRLRPNELVQGGIGFWLPWPCSWSISIYCSEKLLISQQGMKACLKVKVWFPLPVHINESFLTFKNRRALKKM